LISPQAHGGIVAFQGRSHRDWFELLGLNLSRLAKRIQSLGFEIKNNQLTNLRIEIKVLHKSSKFPTQIIN